MQRYVGDPSMSAEERSKKRLPPVVCGGWETAKITVAMLKPLFYRRTIDAQGVVHEGPTSLWLTHNETAQRVISIMIGAIDLAMFRDRQKPEAERRWKNGMINPAKALLDYELPKDCRKDAVPRRSIPYEQAPRYYQRLLEIAGTPAAGAPDARIPATTTAVLHSLRWLSVGAARRRRC